MAFALVCEALKNPETRLRLPSDIPIGRRDKHLLKTSKMSMSIRFLSISVYPPVNGYGDDVREDYSPALHIYSAKWSLATWVAELSNGISISISLV